MPTAALYWPNKLVATISKIYFLYSEKWQQLMITVTVMPILSMVFDMYYFYAHE